MKAFQQALSFGEKWDWESCHCSLLVRKVAVLWSYRIPNKWRFQDRCL